MTAGRRIMNIATFTLTEQENQILHVLAQKTGKSQEELLHEAVARLVADFSQHEWVMTEEFSAMSAILSDEELVLNAEALFLQLDQAEAAYG
jgi:hypothetical protein